MLPEVVEVVFTINPIWPMPDAIDGMVSARLTVAAAPTLRGQSRPKMSRLAMPSMSMFVGPQADTGAEKTVAPKRIAYAVPGPLACTGMDASEPTPETLHGAPASGV